MKIKPFLNNHFLLDNKVAEKFYNEFTKNEFTKNQPIIDYHSHIVPEDIASNRNFKNITQIWLESDHSKWRTIRTFD